MLEQITQLMDQRLKPLHDSVYQLQHHVGYIQREKRSHRLDKKDIKWKKGVTRQQCDLCTIAKNEYKMEQTLCDTKICDSKVSRSEIVKKGWERVKNRMRDLLMPGINTGSKVLVSRKDSLKTCSRKVIS